MLAVFRNDYPPIHEIGALLTLRVTQGFAESRGGLQLLALLWTSERKRSEF